MDRNSKLMLIGLLVVIAFTVFIYYRLNVNKNSMNNVDEKTEQLFSKKMKTYNLNDIGLKLKSPARLKEKSATLNSDTKTFIEDFSSYGYTLGFFSIRASKATFKKEGTNSLAQIKDALIQQISGVQGVSSPDFKYDETTFAGMQALMINGKADMDEYQKTLGFKSLLFGDNKSFWQVVVSYDKTDKSVANKVSEIIDSITLTEK